MPDPHHYQPNQPFVVSELIDGEAVIMNLKSGHYYSARHTGALLWAWVEQGRAPGAMAASLSALYGGAAADYAPAVAAFVASLVEQGLVCAAAADAEAARPAAPAGDAPAPPRAYRPPVLEVFADMQDLLLLDPIHDTDEVGWPVAKPTRPPAD